MMALAVPTNASLFDGVMRITNICFAGCAIAIQVIFLINYTVIKSEICSRLECVGANGIYVRIECECASMATKVIRLLD